MSSEGRGALASGCWGRRVHFAPHCIGSDKVEEKAIWWEYLSKQLVLSAGYPFDHALTNGGHYLNLEVTWVGFSWVG